MKATKLSVFFVLLIVLYSFKGHKNTYFSPIGTTINDFSLRNTDNTDVALSQYKDAKGFIIIFTCNHCPFAKLYSPRLNDLNKKYKPLGVPLLAINSMDSVMYEEESFEKMQEKVASDKLNFPYLQDSNQCVGKSFDAEHTPQAFVIWKENGNWVVKYSGSVDDNGEHPKKAMPFIANAVDDLLKNKPVSLPQTESFGCKIFYRKQ
jgi:peroxiredoxin